MPDYPDFTQYAFIDIVAQTLTEIINRPVYGGALVSYVGIEVIAGETTELISVAGEGMIYGGYVMVFGVNDQSGDIWKAEIDGNVQSSITFEQLRTFGLIIPYGLSPVLTAFDEIEFRYGAIMPYGTTFEESLKLSYTEAHDRTPTVVCLMSYALA